MSPVAVLLSERQQDIAPFEHDRPDEGGFVRQLVNLNLDRAYDYLAAGDPDRAECEVIDAVAVLRHWTDQMQAAAEVETAP